MTKRERDAQEALEALRVTTPVVVLNTHYSGLAVARDLAPLGVRVIGISAVAESHGNRSRYLEYRAAPDSFTQQPELLPFLFRLADELGVRAILLPTRDHDINFISAHRAALDERFIFPMAQPATLERIMNKDSLAAIANEVGVSTPRTVTVRRADEISHARELRFPCVCKPVYASQWRKRDMWDAVGRQKARKVDSFDALERFYRGFSDLDPVVCIQEWVEGGEEKLLIFGSYCSANHDVVASFTARKRLQYPPLAGTGIVVEAIEVPEVQAPSLALLRRVKYHGVSEIEYKRDTRDGQLYLIEINPRHWDQHGLGTKVGVNLSETLYRDATGQPARPMKQGHQRTLWVAEREYSRHVLRCLTGRAPLRDLKIIWGVPRTWALYDRSDPAPFLSLVGLD